MEEQRKKHILLLGLYVFLYMLVKHVVDIQTLILQGECEKCEKIILFGKHSLSKPCKFSKVGVNHPNCLRIEFWLSS
jgi:hypothetical protein